MNSVLDPGVEGPVLRSKLTKLIAEPPTADKWSYIPARVMVATAEVVVEW